ncbi:MAG: nucleoside triphosphate pyrophosphohydrolase family protein [Minisyncoccia bacterium]
MSYTFDEYQKESRKTAVYPDIGKNFIYPTLGLVGEAGEVAEKVKKILRDDSGKISQEKLDLLKKELGDVLWYIANLATELDLSMENVAMHNIEKLKSRLERNKIHGSGDVR